MIGFSLGGVRLSFNFWFFAVIGLFLVLDHEVLIFYLAIPVLIHEAGHLIAMLLLGIPIHSIRFTPVSVNIRRLGASPLPFYKDIILASTGILANLLAAVLLRLFCFQSLRTMTLVASNTAIAMFHMLPVGNLDGGTICKLLCEWYLSPDTALRISRFVSMAVLTPLFAGSIFLLLRGGNFTLLLTCIYLAITLIIRDDG